MEKTKGKHITGAVLLIVLMTVLDQWCKYLAIIHLRDQEDIPLIGSALRLHYLENRGAAFGILQNQRWIFIILCGLFLILAGYAFYRLPKSRHYLPMNLLLVTFTAGGIGNLIDRVFRGYVVDFIYFAPIDFPVFNVADIYVTVSFFIFLLYFIFYYKEEDFKCIFSKEA